MLYTRQQQLRQKNIKTLMNEVQSKLRGFVIQIFPPQIQYFYDNMCYVQARMTLLNQYAGELDKISAANTILTLWQKYAPINY